MQLKKLIDKMPYLMWLAILQSGLIFTLAIVMGLAGTVPLHQRRIWIIYLPVWLFTALYVVVRGAFELQATGLKYSATIGDRNEARKRREAGRPTR